MSEVDPTLDCFVEATREVLESLSMLDLELKQRTGDDPGEPELLAVTSYMPLMRGAVADRMLVLTLSRPLARRFIAAMLGIDEDEVENGSELQDGIGEIANMIAGIAKQKVDATEQAFTLSLPISLSNREELPVTERTLTNGCTACCTVGGEPLRLTLLWNDVR